MLSVTIEDKDLVRILRKETGLDIKEIYGLKVTETGGLQVFWRVY